MQYQSNGGCTGFHKKMDFIPKILEVVFYTTRRKATQFAAWFVLTYWCYIVCLCYRWSCWKCIQFCKITFSGTMTSYEFSYFLKCSFIIKQKHIWISWTEISNRSVHAVLALFNAIILFLYCVFYIPHSHSNIGFFLSILFLNSLDPCGIIPSLFYSHRVHSNVYTSLVWRCVYLNDSDQLFGC